MPDAEMPIFRGQPNASPGRLSKAGNHKKNDSSRDDQMAHCRARAQASNRCVRPVWRLSPPHVLFIPPGVRRPSFSSVSVPSCRSQSLLSRSPVLVSLCVAAGKRCSAASSSDVLALSISAFRSPCELLPFLATSNTWPRLPRYEQKRASSPPLHRPI
ncbi:hypothetical protein M441DRAFT_208416 [Trichoderma asperellum CBS 433.97]|uniref:Uncharacterized protein n=1 Tax=Trichoderma asperellum (strain ATCC 204424 / CBS 433.97 / NBRC 101777) TaxID=1042311 RepID=A0A2T3ZMN0_TRIA4|nr:hypothetical protein M441DRAFT_208416 [Trichoderma asperellum CBS 433.97]PTB46058.1 hypothetical protein M441DRAFT_208416 [Trichoderma asperellum CBS 433.97]